MCGYFFALFLFLFLWTTNRLFLFAFAHRLHTYLQESTFLFLTLFLFLFAVFIFYFDTFSVFISLCFLLWSLFISLFSFFFLRVDVSRSANVLFLASTVMVPIGNVAFSLNFVPHHQDLKPSDTAGLFFILTGTRRVRACHYYCRSYCSLPEVLLLKYAFFSVSSFFSHLFFHLFFTFLFISKVFPATVVLTARLCPCWNTRVEAL